MATGTYARASVGESRGKWAVDTENWWNWFVGTPPEIERLVELRITPWKTTIHVWHAFTYKKKPHVGIFIPYIDLFGICKDKSSEPNLHDFGFFRPADGMGGWRGFWSVNHGVIGLFTQKKNRKEVSKMSGKHSKSYHGQNKCVFVFFWDWPSFVPSGCWFMMYIRIAPHPATKVKINVMPHQTCDSFGDLSKGVAHKDIYNFQKKTPSLPISSV